MVQHNIFSGIVHNVSNSLFVSGTAIQYAFAMATFHISCVTGIAFIGPILRTVGVETPLNVTSILWFGGGTKRIVGGMLNATVSTIVNAVPNLNGF